MARIKKPHSNSHQYLLPFHCIGRFAARVDTHIDSLEVSNIHALIEWKYQTDKQDGTWVIKDDSTNGTWIDGTRLTPNTTVPLKVGQRIAFAHKQQDFLEVVDLAPPSNILINTSSNMGDIVLNRYNLLPDENPEWVLWSDEDTQQWFLKRSDDIDDDNVSVIKHGKSIHFDKQVWRTFFPVLSAPTTVTAKSAYSLRQFNFCFDVSQNEENIQLTLNCRNQTIDLKAKSQFELLVHLARKKIADEKNALKPKEQGWIDKSQIQTDLRISESHLNIHIHRLRAHFAELLPEINDQEVLFERRRGMIRLGIDTAQLLIQGGSRFVSSQ